jgi:hypothetical protein
MKSINNPVTYLRIIILPVPYDQSVALHLQVAREHQCFSLSQQLSKGIEIPNGFDDLSSVALPNASNDTSTP